MNKILQEIKDNAGEFSYVNPRLFTGRINRILKKPQIQMEYHAAMFAYIALRRLQSFEFNGYTKVPRHYVLTHSKGPIIPRDCDSCDWRWNIIGRPPLWMDYCCHSACHWLSLPNARLAEQLFPDNYWQILSSPGHTTAIDVEAKLLFDLNYVALNVNEATAFSQVFSIPNEVTLEEVDDYSYLDGLAGIAVNLFRKLDNLSPEEVKEELPKIREVFSLLNVNQLPTQQQTKPKQCLTQSPQELVTTSI